MTELDDYVHAGPRYTLGGSNKGNGQGMSMRDYFAGQALAGDMANSDEGVFRNDVDGKYLLDRAVFFYRMADAMLEARKTTGEDNK
jgi:hypothetical protein